MGITAQTHHDLYYEYYRLITISEGGLTPKMIEEAEEFIAAVETRMGSTSGLSLVMIAQVRRMLLWEPSRK